MNDSTIQTVYRTALMQLGMMDAYASEDLNNRLSVKILKLLRDVSSSSQPLDSKFQTLCGEAAMISGMVKAYALEDPSNPISVKILKHLGVVVPIKEVNPFDSLKRVKQQSIPIQIDSDNEDVEHVVEKKQCSNCSQIQGVSGLLCPYCDIKKKHDATISKKKSTYEEFKQRHQESAESSESLSLDSSSSSSDDTTAAVVTHIKKKQRRCQEELNNIPKGTYKRPVNGMRTCYGECKETKGVEHFAHGNLCKLCSSKYAYDMQKANKANKK
jgi:hypothetical protein